MTEQNPLEQPALPTQPGSFTWTPPDAASWAVPVAWQQPAAGPSGHPARWRATAAWSIVVVAAALIAGALGYEIGLRHSRIDSPVQGLKAAASGPCQAGQTASSPAQTSAAGQALLARVLPMPAGDTAITGDHEGVLSLNAYVSVLYGNDMAERQRLSARCFQTAVHRVWGSPGGTITSVWLIQFGSRAGARSYVLAMEQASEDDRANTDVFRVSDVGDGMGFGDPKLDKYGNTFTRTMGDVGNVAIYISLFVPARTDNAAAASVLRQQSALLTSGSP
jgi:hypothetical protein